MNITPKKESDNTGFHYMVTDAQTRKHQVKSAGEIINRVESTAKFIYEIQTPEARERMKKAKHFKW